VPWLLLHHDDAAAVAVDDDDGRVSESGVTAGVEVKVMPEYVLTAVHV
jgi:hypothetical protein